MAKLLEIDFNSRYILMSREPMDEKEKAEISIVWETFVASGTPTLLVVDGTKYQLIKKEE